jgi:mono/diheme cytochrome c family protein
MRTSLTLILTLSLVACGDDDDGPTGTPDAMMQMTPDARLADARPPDAMSGVSVARGDYLVNKTILCIDCHTPRNPDGSFQTDKHLSGVQCLIDVMPMNDQAGCLHSRNLTNHATGLMTRTDQQIKDMIMIGVRPDGTFLHPVMPSWQLARLTPDDADSIVAYLRTVPGVDHTVPANQAPFNNVPAATAPMTDAEVPTVTATVSGTTQASADRGRYLAQFSCLDCHTPTTEPGNPRPLQFDKAFQGGRAFVIGGPFGTVTTRNLTPHLTGLLGYTVADIVRVLREGKDKDMKGVCPPMPSALGGPLTGITEADATDIANYLVNLAPAEADWPLCQIP